jgi:hypothetical protein
MSLVDIGLFEPELVAKLSMSITIFRRTDKDELLEEVNTVDLLVEDEDVDQSVRDSVSSKDGVVRERCRDGAYDGSLSYCVFCVLDRGCRHLKTVAAVS